MIRDAFEQRCPLFAQREKEIRSFVTESRYREELEYLYASMPLSDAANYPPELFEGFAAHGRFLRENVPWCRDLSEELYLNQVLFHRVNDEEISDCRALFYEKLWPLVQDKSMEEAAKIINYWCLEEATYRLTDERTASPETVLRCAFGRCGEESMFAVNALRAVGIPARQVYAPKWPHCDDNHAWVELFCDGRWQYLGACEPEESLNRGWFMAAASRAMLVHSRTFGPVGMQEELISDDGCMSLWNHLPRYADSKKLIVTVTEDTKPLAGVTVRCELLNYAEFAAISRQITDEKGQISLTTGLGDLHLHCVKDGRFLTRKIDLRKEQEILIDFGEARSYETQERDGIDFDMQPPKDNMNYLHPQSEEVKLLRQKKFDAAVEKRRQKEAAYLNEQQSEQLLLQRGWSEETAKRGARLLAGSYGNEQELLTFLDDGCLDMKLSLLEALTEKDLYDCKAELLQEAYDEALRFEAACPQELFIPYLMNPRIGREVLKPWRKALPQQFTDEEKAKFLADPTTIGEWIRHHIIHQPKQEHPDLLTTPLAALQSRSGNQRSQDSLFVAICRSLGIPARLAPDDQRPQFWNREIAAFVDAMPKQEGQLLNFLLESEETEPWIYSQNWSLARLEQGEYVTLDLSAEKWTGNQLPLQLAPGQYRLLTCKRMPTGALFAKEYRFELKQNGDRLSICQRKAKLTDLLSDKPIPDFNLYTEEGKACSMAELCAGRTNLFLWLEEGKEPTEHILNEMEDLRDGFSKLNANIFFVLKSKDALQDARIHRALEHIPGIVVLYDDFRDTMSMLARRMYIDPDKLPIVVLCSEGLNGIYGSSGYNVGLGDLILKIFNELN